MRFKAFEHGAPGCEALVSRLTLESSSYALQGLVLKKDLAMKTKAPGERDEGAEKRERRRRDHSDYARAWGSPQQGLRVLHSPRRRDHSEGPGMTKHPDDDPQKGTIILTTTHIIHYSSFHFLFHYPPYNPNITLILPLWVPYGLFNSSVVL